MSSDAPASRCALCGRSFRPGERVLGQWDAGSLRVAHEECAEEVVT